MGAAERAETVLNLCEDTNKHQPRLEIIIITTSTNNQVAEDAIGILITRPDLEVGKSILNSLNYYHY